MTHKRTIPGAIVSTDPEFRQTLRLALQQGDQGVALGAEIAAPYDSISPEQVQALREIDPELIFLDLEDDPATGIRFAQFLTDASPGRRFIAAGPDLSAELLLEAMRAGVAEYLPKPVSPEALAAAVQRVGRKLAHANGRGAGGARKAGELFAVFSAKGGAGSTTVATNLAIHLQHLTGKKTLLLDLDLELGEIAVFLGMQPRFNFVDMIRNFHRMDAELLASYIERHDSGVHLLSAPFHPERAETVTPDAIRKVLQFLRQHYEYILIDTPRSFSASTLAVFEQAETVFIVSSVDLPSLRNIKRCMPLLARVTATGAARDKVRLVVNRYHPDDIISLEEVERTLGLDVYWTLANDYETVMQGINSGQPVIQNNGSRFAQDLRALGAEIAGLGGGQNGRRTRLGSLRKLFSRKTEGVAQ